MMRMRMKTSRSTRSQVSRLTVEEAGISCGIYSRHMEHALQGSTTPYISASRASCSRR
ncbi:hypothetical protein FOVG_19978 [Fusarium oxysporum f. sp. pisi HDV247]|uniref:Uncharacterized protein n=1 Tax=Fusarium oxysporum f. sp. pisi HDV247 TaxID=1080344 RepID=W9NCI6_FUSOX|nr:hypothetical protein FOVG_19978 [Fusarium oxysporum f. sp. pisi HDV247]